MVAGPYHGFDEWVWCEASTVWRGQPPGVEARSTGNRFVHAWRGFHFITVDPFPTPPLAFASLDEALRALPPAPMLDRGVQRS